MEFVIIADIFSIFLLEMENYCQDRFQKLSLLTNWIFSTNRVIYFWTKLPNYIKNRKRVEIFGLNLMVSEKWWEKEFQNVYLGTIGELLNKM